MLHNKKQGYRLKQGEQIVEIQNILVTSRMYKELEGIIEREDKRGKTFRYVDEKNINDEDLKWADAYMSFYPVENFAFHQMKWVHSLGAGVIATSN